MITSLLDPGLRSGLQDDAYDGKLTLSYTETNAEAKKQLYKKVKAILGKLDMNPDHLIHRFAYMKNSIPIACAPTRQAPPVSARILRRPS